jgi:hypothetical protein
LTSGVKVIGEQAAAQVREIGFQWHFVVHRDLGVGMSGIRDCCIAVRVGR